MRWRRSFRFREVFVKRQRHRSPTVSQTSVLNCREGAPENAKESTLPFIENVLATTKAVEAVKSIDPRIFVEGEVDSACEPRTTPTSDREFSFPLAQLHSTLTAPALRFLLRLYKIEGDIILRGCFKRTPSYVHQDRNHRIT
jgi:hypothetical protein